MKKHELGTAQTGNQYMCRCVHADHRTFCADLFSTTEKIRIFTRLYHHLVLDREAHSKPSASLFYRQVYAMKNYFEHLVRANFRFGRMCRC